ncbi:MAG: MAPEG family protein [Pseudomonadota bacterium]
MQFPMITALTAAAIAFLQVYLMMSVGAVRLRTGIGIGDGGEESLALRMRRHGNLTENAPLFLILLALTELAGGIPLGVALLGATFLLARLAHAVALSKTSGPHPLRPVGAFGTVLTTLGAAGYLVWLTL